MDMLHGLSGGTKRIEPQFPHLEIRVASLATLSPLRAVVRTGERVAVWAVKKHPCEAACSPVSRGGRAFQRPWARLLSWSLHPASCFSGPQRVMEKLP